MEDIITYLLVFGLGWWLGSKVTAAIQMISFSQVLRELGISEQQLMEVHAKVKRDLYPNAESEESEDEYIGKLPVVEIKVERHNDTLYVFRKDTDEFLGQGSDVESLIRRMGEKLCGVRLSISQEDGADLIGGHYNFDLADKSIKKVD